MLKRLVESYAKKENAVLMKDVENRQQLLPKQVEIKRNIVVKVSDTRETRMNVYYLKQEMETDEKDIKSDKLPVIVNLHGGGMVCGMMEQNDLLCAKMAQEGYLVYALEYPLIPKADVFEMYRVLSVGLNHINNCLEEYHGDALRVFWTGDSAGAYLIANLAILKSYFEMRRTMDIPEIELPVKGMGFISGMFYTNKKDKIGMVLPRLMFGKEFKKKPFFTYTDLEKPKSLDCLPPSYFVTSKEDMLKHHTLCFEKALREHGQETLLRVFPEDKRLVHAFVALYPEYAESEMAYKEMLAFFEHR